MGPAHHRSMTRPAPHMDARGLHPRRDPGMCPCRRLRRARTLPRGAGFELQLARDQDAPARRHPDYRAPADFTDLARHRLEAPARHSPPVDARGLSYAGLPLHPWRALETGVRERRGQVAARGADLHQAGGNPACAGSGAPPGTLPAALRPARGRADRLHLRSLPEYRRARLAAAVADGEERRARDGRSTGIHSRALADSGGHASRSRAPRSAAGPPG